MRKFLLVTLLVFLPQGAAAQEIEFGPFDLGACTAGCEPFIGKGLNNLQATFENGDLQGIWGTNGTAIIMLETGDGGKLHANVTPSGHANVAIWGQGGTRVAEDPDFVGIWGSNGTAIEPGDLFDIWGTGGSSIAPGFPLSIEYDVSGDVVFIVDTTDAIVELDPGF